MLVDPRAQALVDNFAGQWLQLRKLLAELRTAAIILNSMKHSARP